MDIKLTASPIKRKTSLLQGLSLRHLLTFIIVLLILGLLQPAFA